LPRDEKIPPAVSRITGISDDSLRAAKTPKIIWQHLVAAVIEHMVLHSAHLIRRARWFCLLSESSLAWESANRSDQLKTLVVFEGGSIFKRDDIESAGKVPVPPGFDKSFRRRQKQFSLMTYDRLRILTTELRRLISEYRPIELRLRPTVVLGNDELKRALRWV
jgi:hypothetical protein